LPGLERRPGGGRVPEGAGGRLRARVAPGQLDPRPDAELAVDPAQVGVDGARAEYQLLGDLAVGVAGGDQAGDLLLAGRQAVDVRRRCQPLDAPAEPAELAGGVAAQPLGAEAGE